MDDGQRTHKPTPKRLRELRGRGEIALSRDLVSAAAFAGGAIALIGFGGAAFASIRSLARDASLAADGLPHDELAGEAIHAFVLAAVPVVIGAAIGALVAIVGQLGWPPALAGIKLDLTRLSPAGNLGRAFAPVEMAKRTGSAFAKLAAVGAIIATALTAAAALHPGSPVALANAIGATVVHALELVIGALLAIAAVDYLISRYQHMARAKMSTEELKRELRESDGDPMLRGKRRAKMKELAKRRIASAVAKADVVVVNPTHYAVALRYDETKDAAPIVVAKGTDEVAEKIREIARQHGVPVLARPPLARALHKLVKEGRPVPAKLYRAVAEVLAFVYRVRNRGLS